MEHIQFEGVKTSLKQTKDGYSLTLAVHPDDLPEDLMRDFVGARYMVVMVRLGDNEMPVERDKKSDPSVAVAGMLCRNPVFWEFIDAYSQDQVKTERECAEWLTMALGIESRAELKTNEEAKKALANLKHQFDLWNR